MLAQLHRRLAYIQRSSLVLAQTLDATLQDAACWARSGGPYHFGGVAGRRPGPYVYTHTHALLISLGVTSWCWVGGQTFGDRGLSMLKLWRIPKASVELTNHTKRDNIRDATGTTLCNSQKLTNAFCRCFLWVLRLKTPNALELSSHAANQKIETLHR